MMTLDEAINHARHCSDTWSDTACGAEHAQLAEWLTELKQLKENKGDLISRQALLKQIDIDSDGEPGYYGDTWKFIDTINNMLSVSSPSTDLISRQDALTMILGEPSESHYPAWYAEKIRQLQSATCGNLEKPEKPQHWEGEAADCNLDCISRSAAIDAPPKTNESIPIEWINEKIKLVRESGIRLLMGKADSWQDLVAQWKVEQEKPNINYNEKIQKIVEDMKSDGLPSAQPDNTCHGCRYEKVYKAYNAPCVSCARWFTDWYERRTDE